MDEESIWRLYRFAVEDQQAEADQREIDQRKRDAEIGEQGA